MTWWDFALCRGMDADEFVTERGQDVRKAKAVCKGCPVADPCREWAVDHFELGVWGGTSERQRRKLRAQRPLPERKCKRVECGECFVPRFPQQFYCTPKCARAVATQAYNRRRKAAA